MRKGTVRAFVKTLNGEVGVTEGGNNSQKYGVWDNLPNSAWCGQFVGWCLEHSGVPGDWRGKDSQRLTTQAIEKWRNEGRFYHNPKVGDLVFFDWKGGSSTDHVGVVVGTGDWRTHKSVQTIEGNSSKGDLPQGVYRHNRSSEYIVGFARPKFRTGPHVARRIRLMRAPSLSLGSRHRAVKIVQRILHVEPTGVFDRRLNVAVRRFQKDHGLVIDGIVGPITKKALLSQ